MRIFAETPFCILHAKFFASHFVVYQVIDEFKCCALGVLMIKLVLRTCGITWPILGVKITTYLKFSMT